ncbi:hypothetical protein CP556_06910 [Natrinema sp. CBA1119]|nr:hypothetical protein CP556_06910 [Natrinema sp. CBA1119]
MTRSRTTGRTPPNQRTHVERVRLEPEDSRVSSIDTADGFPSATGRKRIARKAANAARIQHGNVRSKPQ